MIPFLKICLYIYLVKFTHFNPSQNVSPVLLLNGLVMDTNKDSIANNYPNKEP